MIITHLTNGFGNNLFQYVAARLLSEFHNQDLIVMPPTSDYYAIQDLKNVGVKFKDLNFRANAIVINENNYKKAFDKSLKHHDFVVQGYFEDYTFFNQKIDLIKSWFPAINIRDNNDLVLHYRAGDRLMYKNEFEYKPKVRSFIDAIDQFDFDNLHIVTDMPNWQHISKEDFESMKFHVDVLPQERVDIQLSVDYFNSFVDGLSRYNPIVEKRTISEDFNFIRSFKNILFQHGTLGWWAAVLSEAEKVGVYGPWRPWKGSSNKNLSQIPLNNWFKWK